MRSSNARHRRGERRCWRSLCREPANKHQTVTASERRGIYGNHARHVDIRSGAARRLAVDRRAAAAAERWEHRPRSDTAWGERRSREDGERVAASRGLISPIT